MVFCTRTFEAKCSDLSPNNLQRLSVGNNNIQRVQIRIHGEK